MLGATIKTVLLGPLSTSEKEMAAGDNKYNSMNFGSQLLSLSPALASS